MDNLNEMKEEPLKLNDRFTKYESEGAKSDENMISFSDNSSSQLHTEDSLDRFIEALVELARTNFQSSCDTIDLSRCEICQGFMSDPVTLSCGHTFMKSCILVNDELKIWTCPKCSRPHVKNYILKLKPSVTICTLLEKWWGKEFEGAKIFHEGKLLFDKGDVMEAIQRFNYAVDFDPLNHLAYYYRSKAYFSIGQSVAALNDADIVVKLHSTWPMAYFHKGTIQIALNHFQEAAISFLHCYILGNNKAAYAFLSMCARNEAIKLIHSICNSSCRKSFQSSEPLPLNACSTLTGSQCSLSSGDSCDSTTFNNNDNTMDEEQQHLISLSERNDIFQLPKVFLEQLYKLVYDVKKSLQDSKSSRQKPVSSSLIDRLDFECPLCMRLLFQPVTTLCGHTFCRTCLDRCFDHNPSCPLCKTSLEVCISERRQVTQIVNFAIQTLLPDDYIERHKIYVEEMEELANAGKDLEHVVPLFVCTVAYPTVPCPLHVFEPRYRLMIRQCVESGTNQFGMCAYINEDDEDESIPCIGTMVDICNVKLLPDGRSIVDTVGSRRFRVLRKGMRDGYHTGAVDFLHDISVPDEEIRETSQLHQFTRTNASTWFEKLPRLTQHRILAHFGPMPAVEDDYMISSDGPSWFWWMLAILPLEPKMQMQIIGMTSLRRRLEALCQVLFRLENTESL